MIAKPKLTCRLANIQLIAEGTITDLVNCQSDAPRILALAIIERSASRTPWKALWKTTKNTITKASATLDARPRPNSMMKIGASTTRGIELMTLRQIEQT